jgi:hypothetical protein
VEVDGGITSYHRRLTLDQLIEAEMWCSTVARLILGSEIGLMCSATVQNRPVSCFSANTGQSSPDHVIKGMLKRLIVLHQKEKSGNAHDSA